MDEMSEICDIYEIDVEMDESQLESKLFFCTMTFMQTAPCLQKVDQLIRVTIL